MITPAAGSEYSYRVTVANTGTVPAQIGAYTVVAYDASGYATGTRQGGGEDPASRAGRVTFGLGRR